MASPYVSPLGAAIAPIQQYLMQREVSKRQALADALAQEREKRMARNDQLDYQSKLEEIDMRRKNYAQAAEDRKAALDEARAAKIEERTQKGDVFDQETIDLLKRTGRGYLVTQQGGHLGDAGAAGPEGFTEEGPVIRSASRGGSKQLQAEADAKAKLEQAQAKEDAKKEAADKGVFERSLKTNTTRIDATAKPYEERQRRIENTIASMEQGTLITDALVAPELLTAMAGGLGSGLRMTDTELNRIIRGRTPLESFKVAVNKWLADPKAEKIRDFSPEQIASINDLLKEVGRQNMQRIDTINAARDALDNATTPHEHQMILTQLKKDLNALSGGQKEYIENAPGKGEQGKKPPQGASSTPGRTVIRQNPDGSFSDSTESKPATQSAVPAQPAKSPADINLPASGVVRLPVAPLTSTSMPLTGNAQEPNVQSSGGVQEMQKSPMLDPTGPRQLSEAGAAALKQREGFRPSASQDTGNLAVGYGFNTFQGKPVPAGMTITKDQADAEFARQIEKTYKPIVDQNLKVPVTQDQYDALISVAFNHPRTALRIIAKLNAHQPVTIEDFMVSATVHGQPDEGLQNRRTQEFAPFAE